MSTSPYRKFFVLLCTFLLVLPLSACARPNGTMPDLFSGTEVTAIQVDVGNANPEDLRAAQLLVPPSNVPDVELPSAITTAEETLGKIIPQNEYAVFQKGVNSLQNKLLTQGKPATQVNREIYGKIWVAIQQMVSMAGSSEFMILVLPQSVMDHCPEGTAPNPAVPGQCDIIG